MARRVHRQKDWSGGYNLYVSPADLAENESQRLDDVLVTQPIGRMVKRYGFAKEVSTAMTDSAVFFLEEYLVDNLATGELPATGRQLIVIVYGSSASYYTVRRWNGTSWVALTTVAQRIGGLNGSQASFSKVNEELRVELGPVGTTNFIMPNLWYGRIVRTYFPGVPVSFDGRYLSTASMLPYSYVPDNANLTASVGNPVSNPTGALDVNCKIIQVLIAGSNIPLSRYRFTYEYDDYQCTPFVRVNSNATAGPPDSVRGYLCYDDTATTFNSNRIAIRILKAAWDATAVHDDIEKFNKRITAIYLWRAERVVGASAPTDAEYRLVTRIGLDEGTWTETSVNVDINGTGSVAHTFYQTLFDDDKTAAQLIEAGYGQFYQDFIGHAGGDDRLDAGISFFHKGIRFAAIGRKRLVYDTTQAAGGAAADQLRNDRLWYNPLQNTTDPPSFAYDSFPAELFLPISQGDGDEIVAGGDDGERALIWKQNRTFALHVAVDDLAASEIEIIAGEGQGCIAHRTVIKTPHGWIYLTPQTVGLYVNGRTQDIGKAIRSDAKPGTAASRLSLAGFTTSEKQSAFAAWDPVNEDYYLFIPDDTAIKTYAFVKSFRESWTGWVRYRYNSGSGSAVQFSDAVRPHAQDQRLLALQALSGAHRVMLLNSGTTDDGDVITVDWTSREFEADDDTTETELQMIGIKHRCEAFSVGLNADGAAVDLDPGAAGNLVSFGTQNVMKQMLKAVPRGATGSAMELTINATGRVEIDSVSIIVDERKNLPVSG